MPDIFLFRVKIIERSQRTLFNSDKSRPVFLKQQIARKPHAEIRRGYTWHVGNVRAVGSFRLIFALGRTTKTSREEFDNESGDFRAVEDEDAPFTFAYIDSEIGLLGVLPKNRLAPTARAIARNLERILNEQTDVRRSGLRIEISEVWDPEDFIQQIRKAHAVVGFTVQFGHPNPFDVEEQFHRPMERYLKATEGVKGRATVQGDDLDRGTVEDVVRSIASTGNDASARIRKKKGQRPVLHRLKGDAIRVPVDEDHAEHPENVFEEIEKAYHHVRDRGDKP